MHVCVCERERGGRGEEERVRARAVKEGLPDARSRVLCVRGEYSRSRPPTNSRPLAGLGMCLRTQCVVLRHTHTHIHTHTQSCSTLGLVLSLPSTLPRRPGSGWLGDAPAYSIHGTARRTDISKGAPGQKPSCLDDPGPGMYEAPNAMGSQARRMLCIT